MGSIPQITPAPRRADDDDTMPDGGLLGRIVTSEARCAYDVTPLPAPLPSLRLPGDMISVEFDAAFHEQMRKHRLRRDTEVEVTVSMPDTPQS